MTLSYQVKKGATNVSVTIRIIDSTDGTPETGVEHNTAGIDLQYRREGAASTAITEAALAALTTAHTDGGIEHIGNGYYRLDVPDAAFATGASGVLIHGTVTGMVVIGAYCHLVDIDDQDGVRMGLTALPNAAAEAAGGLYTRGTGAGQINQPANGQIDANVAAMAANVLTAAAIAADAITAAKIASNAIGAAEIADDAITAAKIASGAIDADAIATDAITAAKIAANAITAAKIASNAIGAAELATDGVNEIRDAILSDSTPFAGANIDAAITSRLAPTTAGRTLDITAGGCAGIDWGNIENKGATVDLSATDINLCDTVSALTGHTVQTGDTFALANGAQGFVAIDTVVDAIKAKTDSLNFTVAGKVDANTQYINGAQVVGDGNATPWDGA